MMKCVELSILLQPEMIAPGARKRGAGRHQPQRTPGNDLLSLFSFFFVLFMAIVVNCPNAGNRTRCARIPRLATVSCNQPNDVILTGSLSRS
jgi:hypothetical protein